MNAATTHEYIWTRTNEIALPEFGPVSENYHAALVVDGQDDIYLWVAEPEARVEASGQYDSAWDDAEFKDAVYAVMQEMFRGADSEAPQEETFTLQFDPGRDQAEEWVIEKDDAESPAGCDRCGQTAFADDQLVEQSNGQRICGGCVYEQATA